MPTQQQHAEQTDHIVPGAEAIPTWSELASSELPPRENPVDEVSESAHKPARRRGWAVPVLVVVALVAAVAVTAVAMPSGNSDKGDITTPTSAVEPSVPPTTFPEAPKSTTTAEDIVNGSAMTSFTSKLAPKKVIDGYLNDFAVIGWSTLAREGNDDLAVLKLQGGSQYATIVVARDAAGGSVGTACKGSQSDAVNACAMGIR